MGKEVKTNAMRILDRSNIKYKLNTYNCDNFTDGKQIADMLGQDYNISFKTLVAAGKSTQYYVFVIPVAEELDLKQAAKEAGADIVKFQTFNVDAITSKFAGMAEYQKKNIGLIKSQKEMLSELTLTHSEFIEIAKYCKSKQITFLSTPFDIPSIEFLEQLGGTLWKIPSGEITNYPYLKKIAMTHKNIILSTGMSTLDEVSDAINLLEKNGAGEIILLHCTTQYPTPYEEVNLRAMHTLHTKFGKSFGYSDHTEGIEVAIAAAALGAVVIEKHFVAAVPGLLVYGILKKFSCCLNYSPLRDVVGAYA